MSSTTPTASPHYQRAGELCRRVGARREEAMAAFNLGHAHLDIPQLRDLDRAEHWYRRSLDLRDAHDRIGRAQTTGQLDRVPYERFLDARETGQPDHILLEHLNAAADAYHQALHDLPTDAVTDRATTHNHLGNIYHDGGDFDTALTHYQQSIRYKETAGNRYGAGTTRYNIAIMLAQAGRPADALLHAHAALRDFQPYGPNAVTDIDDTRRLIVHIEQATNQAPT